MQIKPQAMAMPRDTKTLPQGKYGPIFPKSPACYGFTIIAKVKEGREAAVQEYASTNEKAVAAQPDCHAPRKLHYLPWVLFDIGSGLHFMYQGIFDTHFDKYTEDAVALFLRLGVD